MPITLTPDPDLVWTISIDDKSYELHPADITATQATALRIESGGWRVATLLHATREAVDADVIAALVFLAVRQSGDAETSYLDVLALVDAVSSVTLDFGLDDAAAA